MEDKLQAPELMAKVTGTNAILKALATFGQKGEALVGAVVQATAMDVNREAKVNAPKNYGKLAQSIINNVSNGGLRVDIEVGVAYGAFVEFGTGTYVRVPAELQQEAMKFKGYKSGSFDDFLEAISDWCRRKGIPKEAWYPIAMSIRQNGIKPQPYLYPAFVKGRAQLKPRLAKALDRLVREMNASK